MNPTYKLLNENINVISSGNDDIKKLIYGNKSSLQL